MPSRRLGVSLGLDIVPRKTCTLNCVYCQLGPTAHPSVERRRFFDPRNLFTELRERKPNLPAVDFATFSGSGEPTLNADLGELIAGVKAILDCPVCVITNGTLTPDPSVRRDLLGADVILPSLDAVSQAVFECINRPAPGLRIGEIIAGLATLKEEFSGEFHLEILLVAGINDSEEELARLRTAVERIGPDEVHLNTVVRPPAEDFAESVSAGRFFEIADSFGPRARVIADYVGPATRARLLDLEDEIVGYLLRRPARTADLAAMLGRSERVVEGVLRDLTATGRVALQRKDGEVYYLYQGVEE